MQDEPNVRGQDLSRIPHGMASSHGKEMAVQNGLCWQIVRVPGGPTPGVHLSWFARWMLTMLDYQKVSGKEILYIQFFPVFFHGKDPKSEGDPS